MLKLIVYYLTSYEVFSNDGSENQSRPHKSTDSRFFTRKYISLSLSRPSSGIRRNIPQIAKADTPVRDRNVTTSARGRRVAGKIREGTRIRFYLSSIYKTGIFSCFSEKLCRTPETTDTIAKNSTNSYQLIIERSF